MWTLGLFRRLTVSAVIGVTSYLFVLAFLLVVAIYPSQMEPYVIAAKQLGDGIFATASSYARGNYYGQLAVNSIRQHVNMTHVVISIPAILLASIVVGIPLNYILGSARSAFQRIMMALLSVPASVLFVGALILVDLWSPGFYNEVLTVASHTWDKTLEGLRALGNIFPIFKSFSNVATIGTNGHHYVIMAVCSALAALFVNMLFALFSKSRPR